MSRRELERNSPKGAIYTCHFAYLKPSKMKPRLVLNVVTIANEACDGFS